MFTPNGIANMLAPFATWIARARHAHPRFTELIAAAYSVAHQLSLLADVVVRGVCHHDGMAACAGGSYLYRQNGVLARPRHATQSPRSGALIRLHGQISSAPPAAHSGRLDWARRSRREGALEAAAATPRP